MALVVFAGQSNALGYGMDRATLPIGDAALGRTFIWNGQAGHWEVMQPGVNTGTAVEPQAWGPEVAFAQAFRAANPDEPLYIVKSARGSTGLAANPEALDWSPASRGEMFDTTTAWLSQARATLGGAPVDEVFLFQGEQDATDPATAVAYGDNLTAWLAAIRDRWMHDPDGAIAFARIGCATPYADDVRAGQDAVDTADPHAVSFETEDLPMQADQLHCAADGFLQVGKAFFAAFEQD